MKKIIFLIFILNINSCLESKSLKKTESFNKVCDGDLNQVFIESLKNECVTE